MNQVTWVSYDTIADEVLSMRNNPQEKFITMCGSARFYPIFEKLVNVMKSKNVIPLSPERFNIDAEDLSDEDYIRLHQLHTRKIDIADMVLIVDIGGYIGDITKEEIEYAKTVGKRILYLNNVLDGRYLVNEKNK